MSKFIIKDVAKLASRSSRKLLAKWYPQIHFEGSYGFLGDIHGAKGRSLKINLEDGFWVDHAKREHKGGDLVALYAATHSISMPEAAQHVMADLGLSGKLPTAGDAEERRKPTKAAMPVPEGASQAPLASGMRCPLPGSEGYVARAWWPYRDSESRLLFYTVRFERPGEANEKGKPRKKILPFTYHGEQGWRWKGPGEKRNPIYGLDRLAQCPAAPVLLLEGEKAADAAADIFTDHVAVSWLGGLGQLGKADFSPLAGRDVIYWPDADEPGRASVKDVGAKLAAVGAKTLRVVDPPSSLPPGWDLADEAPLSVNVLSLRESAIAFDLAEEHLFQNLDLEQLVSCLVFNVGTEQFIHAESDRRFTKAQIDALYLHKQRYTSHSLLTNARLAKVQRLAYLPGNHRRIVQERSGLTALNLWRPSHVVPQQGDPTPFKDHLRYLCSTDVEFEHLVKMLAHMVQRPGVKLKSAIVLVGKQGTGKSLVGHVMRAILGAHNTGVVESTQIKSAFNDYIEAKHLVIVEEIMALGRVEIMNHLKPLITQTVVTINVKHVKAYEIENFANFLFLSNSEDALKIDKDDRRYFIVTSDALPNSTEYYTNLWQWIEQNLGVLLEWLLSIGLGTFSPDARPPATEGKRRMVEAGRDELEDWLAELIEVGAFPFQGDLVELSDVRRVLRDQASSSRIEHPFTRPALMRALKALGARNLGQKTGIVDGLKTRPSLWAVRSAETYERMSPQTLVELHHAHHTTRTPCGSGQTEIPL